MVHYMCVEHAHTSHYCAFLLTKLATQVVQTQVIMKYIIRLHDLLQLKHNLLPKLSKYQLLLVTYNLLKACLNQPSP